MVAVTSKSSTWLYCLSLAFVANTDLYNVYPARIKYKTKALIIYHQYKSKSLRNLSGDTEDTTETIRSHHDVYHHHILYRLQRLVRLFRALPFQHRINHCTHNPLKSITHSRQIECIKAQFKTQALNTKLLHARFRHHFSSTLGLSFVSSRARESQTKSLQNHNLTTPTTPKPTPAPQDRGRPRTFTGRPETPPKKAILSPQQPRPGPTFPEPSYYFAALERRHESWFGRPKVGAVIKSLSHIASEMRRWRSRHGWH